MPPPPAGKGINMDEFAKKLETQAAVGELLKMLRPAGAPSGTAAVYWPAVGGQQRAYTSSTATRGHRERLEGQHLHVCQMQGEHGGWWGTRRKAGVGGSY